MTAPTDDEQPVEGGRGEEPAAPTGQAGPGSEVVVFTDPERKCVARFEHVGKAVVRRRPRRMARRTVELAVRRVARASVAAWRAERAAHVRSVLAYRVGKGPLDLLRMVWFAVRGHARSIGKGWTFFTYGDLRTDARDARLAGDAEARRKAQELIRADSRARWARLGIFLDRTWKVSGGGGILALALWLVDSMMSRAEMWPWLARLYQTIDAAWSALTATLPIVGVMVAVGWFVAAVYQGRDKSPGAGFLIRPDRGDADSWVDERMISQALAHLGISPMDRFFKDGGELVYTVPARLDGNGTYAQVRLPMGVTADMVADRRDRLAANLGRAKLETWPTEGTEAGLLDLWVADKGTLSRGAGPWPLLTDGEVDIFDGVPVGRSQRGTELNAPIMERNYLAGGIPGQGKTSFVRTLCLGCVLDPTVELRVFVFASNPDFDPFAPRLSRYVKGDDEDAIEAGLGELRKLREDVTRRGKLLERHSAAKVTRKLASAVAGLHPKVVVFDECHELFEHPIYRAEARALAVKVVKKARKCGISLIFATQSPTDRSIPRDLTRNCSNGVAFAVADQVANDGLLGDGKYRQGIRATELRPGDDRGTAVTTGLTANRFELVNVFYVPFDEERDEVTPVITRAKALLADAGVTVPVEEPTEGDEERQEQEPDHLADIHAVLRGEPRVRTQLVLGRLAELNPEEYEHWSPRDLRRALAEAGTATRKSDGVMVIRASDIVRALTERDKNDEDDV